MPNLLIALGAETGFALYGNTIMMSASLVASVIGGWGWGGGILTGVQGFVTTVKPGFVTR